MRIMQIVLICSLVLLTIRCDKESLKPNVEIPPLSTKDSILQILWAVPSYGTTQPILYKNQVAFTKYNSSDFSLVFRDTSNGNVFWSWKPSKYQINGSDISSQSFNVTNQFLSLVGGWDNSFVVDLENRSTLWEHTVAPLGDGEPRFSVQSSYFYHAHDNKTGFEKSLVRTPLDNPIWDTLYTFQDNIWDPVSFETIRAYHSRNGDSLVAFMGSLVAWHHPSGVQLSRTDMTCVNLRTKKIEWSNESFDPIGIANVQYMEVFDNKIYKLGSQFVWCFDAEDGKLIWSRNFEPNNQGFEHFMGNNQAFIHKDWIIAKGADKHMEALDLNTGKVIWQTDEGLSSHYSLHVYKDKYIIYAREGGGGIAVHRLDNGRLIYKNNKIAWGAISGGDLAIDHAADRIYWTDGKYAYCFRLNLP
jgi:outer membrane protein assembly factor BamB